jgi:histidine triad (HIT) family protein
MRELNTQIPDCFICRKHRGEIVIPGGAIYEDDLLYAGHVGMQEGQAAYLGYIIVETKRHAPDLADLTDVESQAVGLLVAHISRALRDSEKAEHIYAFVIGDGVPHFHLHVIPRYPGAPREYWGVHADEWPGAPHGGPQEIIAVCTRLRMYLSSHQH